MIIIIIIIINNTNTYFYNNSNDSKPVTNTIMHNITHKISYTIYTENQCVVQLLCNSVNINCYTNHHNITSVIVCSVTIQPDNHGNHLNNHQQSDQKPHATGCAIGIGTRMQTSKLVANIESYQYHTVGYYSCNTTRTSANW